MTTTTTNLRHPRFTVEASAAAWAAARYQIHHSSDGSVSLGERVFCSPEEADALLLRAIALGLMGESALAWTIGELQRQAEERTRSTATARLAESLRSISGSVRLDAADLIAAIDSLVFRR